MTFLRVDEIPLPGPLQDELHRLDDGTARLPVAGGWALITLGSEPTVRISTTAPPEPGENNEDGTEWVASADGRFRFRTEPSGTVIAERMRRKGWRKAWRRRVAGATLAPPLVSGRRVYVGSLDNQVYALRANNGHALWAKDVGERVSRPLTWWQGRVGEGPAFVELVLLVPDNGGSILALDPYDGGRLASLELPTEEDRLLPPALAAGSGKIVVAVQKYDPSEAALLVFELAPVPPPAPDDDVAYNVPDLSEEGDPD